MDEEQAAQDRRQAALDKLRVQREQKQKEQAGREREPRCGASEPYEGANVVLPGTVSPFNAPWMRRSPAGDSILDADLGARERDQLAETLRQSIRRLEKLVQRHPTDQSYRHRLELEEARLVRLTGEVDGTGGIP